MYEGNGNEAERWHITHAEHHAALRAAEERGANVSVAMVRGLTVRCQELETELRNAYTILAVVRGASAFARFFERLWRKLFWRSK